MSMSLEEREAAIAAIETEIEAQQERIEENLPGLVVRMNAAIRRFDDAIRDWRYYYVRVPYGSDNGEKKYYTRDYIDDPAYDGGFGAMPDRGSEINRPMWPIARNIPLCEDSYDIMSQHNPKNKGYGGNGRYSFPTNSEFDNLWNGQDLDGKNNAVSLVFTCNHGVNLSRGRYQGSGEWGTADMHDQTDEDAAYLISDNEPSIHYSFVGKYSRMSGHPDYGIGVWWNGWPANAWKVWLKEWNGDHRADDNFFEGTALSAFHLGRKPAWYWNRIPQGRGGSFTDDDIDRIIDNTESCDKGGPMYSMSSYATVDKNLIGHSCIWSPIALFQGGPGKQRALRSRTNVNHNLGGEPVYLAAVARVGCGNTLGRGYSSRVCSAWCFTWPSWTSIASENGTMICRVGPDKDSYFKVSRLAWVPQSYKRYLLEYYPQFVTLTPNRNCYVSGYGHYCIELNTVADQRFRDVTGEYSGFDDEELASDIYYYGADGNYANLREVYRRARENGVNNETQWATELGLPTPSETLNTRGIGGSWSNTSYTHFLWSDFTSAGRNIGRTQWVHAADMASWFDKYWECYYAAREICRVSNEIADLEKDFIEDLDRIMDTVTDDDFLDTLTNAYLRPLFDPNGTKSFFGEPSPEALAELSRSVAQVGGTWVSSNSWKKQMLFKEQCFLLSHITQIAAAATSLKSQKRLPYQGEDLDSRLNACLMADGQPYGFVNQLTQDPSVNEFFKLRTHELSVLQPTIRLFKITTMNYWYNRRTGEDYSSPCGTRPRSDGARDAYYSCRRNWRHSLKQIEYKFDGAMTDLSTLMNSNGARGTGVGIKKFSFTYDGSNPFAAKKSIKATLEIFANSFHELIKWRGSNTYGTYQYSELALKTAPATKSMSSRLADQSLEGEIGATAANEVYESETTGLQSLAIAPECDSSVLSEGKSMQNDELKDLNFELKAIVGFALPPGNIDNISPRLRTAVYNSFVTLKLTPTVHEFDVDDMGRVVFRINYLAYAEDFYSAPTFSVFADPEVVAQQMMRRLNYNFLSKTCDHTELSNIKEADQQAILAEKRKSVQHLISSLFSNDKIFYIDKPYGELREWIGRGPFYEGNQILTIRDSSGHESALRSHIDSAVAAYEATSESQDEVSSMLGGSVAAGVDPNAVQMGFCYISDMVDIVLENINRLFNHETGVPAQMEHLITQEPYLQGSELFVDYCEFYTKTQAVYKSRSKYQNLRVLLGPVEIVNQTDPSETMIVNMGDLPVSIKYFTEFLTKRLSTQDDVIYPLTTFLNDLFQDLLRNFLNNDTCFATNIKQRVRLNQATLSSYKPRIETDSPTRSVSSDDPDEITKLILDTPAWREYRRLNLNELPRSERPVLNISGYRDEPDGGDVGPEANLDYLVYFAGRTSPREYMTGNAEVDADKYGIQHYVLGEDRGIVKNIKLNKTNSTGLQEVRFEQSGYDGFKQLHLVYDIDIETYANVKTFPGTYIFVDPRGFAPQSNLIEGDEFNLTEYGIGGYCMIIRSTHEFGPGVARTKLHTKWVHSSANQLEEQAAEEERESNLGDGEASLCRDLRSADPPTPAMDIPDPEEPSMAGQLLDGLGSLIGLGEEED